MQAASLERLTEIQAPIKLPPQGFHDTVDMGEQAVLVHIAPRGEPGLALQEIEDLLSEKVHDEQVGEFDGNESALREVV
jgi:hypothetical protein